MDCKEGIVSKVAADHIVVRMVRSSACSGCHAKGACHSGDAKETELTITDYPRGITEGDRVRILFPDKKGLTAVVYAFVLPLALLVIGATLMSRAEVQESYILLSLLGVLVSYYLGLTLFRKPLMKTFTIKVERI